MARDPRNYYQKTPKQIKGTILTFKRLPETYNAYLEMKKQKDEESHEQQNPKEEDEGTIEQEADGE